MKKLFALLLLPLALFGGNGDIAVGSCALDATQTTDWNTAVGAAAMYGAKASTFNAAVGHRAGEYIANSISNIFIGVRAGKGSSNLVNSVGIGTDALREIGNNTRTTDINGQFYANKGSGTIRVGTGNGDAELVYRNGGLEINGDLKVSGNLTFGENSYARDEAIGNYDFYVDAVRGNDEDNGSLLYPKRTLDGALSLVTSNNSTVCVRAGKYAFPSYLKTDLFSPNTIRTEYKVDIIAVDGAERTSIVEEDGNAAWMCGYSQSMMTIKGFTIKGFKRGSYGGNRLGIFSFIKFIDCVFRDTSATTRKDDGNSGAGIFTQCYLENCRVVNCSFTGYSSSGESHYYYTSVFDLSFLDGCYVDVSSPDGSASISIASEWWNSFVRVNKTKVPPRRNWNGQNVSWADGCFYNTTAIIGDSSYSSPSMSDYNYCIIGEGSGFRSRNLTECYTNSVASVNAMLGTNMRPVQSELRSNPQLRFYGYGAADDIATKNGIVGFCAYAIEKSIPATASAETRDAMRSASLIMSAFATQPAEHLATTMNYEWATDTSSWEGYTED